MYGVIATSSSRTRPIAKPIAMPIGMAMSMPTAIAVSVMTKAGRMVGKKFCVAAATMALGYEAK